MLAQNFKTAKQLHITEHERTALIGVLGMLERGELVYQRFGCDPAPVGEFVGLFNMRNYSATFWCGTVACIAGTADQHYGTDFERRMDSGRATVALNELFLCFGLVGKTTGDITCDEAARALRNYLTTGRPYWNDVVTPNERNK